jgi:large subunit ribosomal protein L3
MVDGERNILVVRGAVPGPKGGVVEIRTSVKSK